MSVDEPKAREGDISQMSTIELAMLPGVADLLLGVRLNFARALSAEQRGDIKMADEFLEEAIDIESK